MNPDEEYEKLKSMSMPELCSKIAQLEAGHTTTNLAHLALELKQMEEKFKYEKEQIQLQHKLNMELVTKQVRWIKFSVILNCVAIILGVVLGWFLSELKSSQQPKSNPQSAIQFQSELSTSETHYGKKADKVPLQPPIKDGSNQ